MRDHFPVVLVGNALSVMVAATRLARDGQEVAIVHGGKGWGGHFSPIQCNETTYDIGMVLYEFTSYNNRPGGAQDVRTYDASIRNDAGRFCDTVRAYVDCYQSTHPIPSPKMYIAGRVHEDLLIANALASLKTLEFATAVEKDLLRILAAQPNPSLHASRKHVAPEFKEFDYEAVSLANHGSTFHARLIEPFCQKLLNLPTRDVLALYHRVAWLPLFYPETLLSHLQASPQPLPPTTFSYPSGECVGHLAQRLKGEMDGNARLSVLQDQVVHVTEDNGGSVALRLANGRQITAGRLGWANPLGDLLRSLGIGNSIAAYDKCSISLAFLLVREDALKLDFTVLSVVDPEFITYRITNQSRCSADGVESARLVLEFNPDYASSRNMQFDAPELRERLGEELVRLGIIASTSQIAALDVKQMANALMLPTRHNRDAVLGEIAAVRSRAPTLSLLGPASGFFSSSLNDQIVQGLQFAATGASSDDQ